MRRLLSTTVVSCALVLVVVYALTGCTRAQITAWVHWHDTDPAGAEAFASQPDVQASLIIGGIWTSPSDGPQFAEWLDAGSPTPGDCDTYVGLFQRFGLPVSTFRAIAWRESGCDHTSFVRDGDDLGGGLLGLNLRAGASRWFAWCGLTVANVTDAETNVACAAEAYARLGMGPWR